MAQGITTRTFGILPNGKNILLFTLDNGSGCIVSLSEFGAAITSIKTNDRSGKPGELCLGYDDLEGYLNDTQYMGVTVGRYANRIENSTFNLNGKSYELDPNEAPHHIHGGRLGFAKQAWSGTGFENSSEVGVSFQLFSEEGENGYPGDLNVRTLYTLTTDNILRIEYLATSTADTFVSLTNHSYFNLSNKNTILGHDVLVESDQMTPVNSMMIPTGDFKPVKNSVFDFRHAQNLEATLTDLAPELSATLGYDTNYVLNGAPDTVHHAARISESTSGRYLDVKTTQPCLQFYTGNHLAGTPSRFGPPLRQYAGLCMEPQDYPNGPNVKHFPTKPLLVGDTYKQRIEFHFGNDVDPS